MASSSLLRFCFVLFDGFSNMVLASAMEPLRAARDLTRNEAMAWQLVTMDGAPVKSSSGIMLQPDCAFADAAPFDALFFVSGYGFRAHAEALNKAALVKIASTAKLVGGLDTGSWLMAKAGLLNGRKATIHWQELKSFEEQFLDVNVTADRHILDGDRASCGGATTIMDLMLGLIRREFGEAVAFDVSNLFVYDSERSARGGRGARNRSIATKAPQLEKAIAHMRLSLEQPCSLHDLSEVAAVSPRTLERLFYRELGVSPGRYFQMIRLNHARALVEETDLAVSEIAARTGFSSSSTLSRAFSRHFRQTIQTLRRTRAR
ncbi:MAG: GlxA family transcriptional regulator [Cohaesibacter sp.]|jgi:transcriptional regulator GlxA family with amidase domain|nr:GlxA family transcriptional regulator [Cohaesibacter sp.]